MSAGTGTTWPHGHRSRGVGEATLRRQLCGENGGLVITTKEAPSSLGSIIVAPSSLHISYKVQARIKIWLR
ncbi:hypothetical protein ZEAMMB73_Zm00001d025978 [Zea mays]|uniref:Uncharacterized protein n=1 Tax=Zea mays TaxID=4577 RepID=K7TR73_MAIZE|nr:hypothetical protein ZEAMMB73_Zm00001d025978 [Zea mays]